MTLLYYYGPVFRVVFAVYREEKPAGKRKKKKAFEVVYETEATAVQVQSKEFIEAEKEKAKKKARNKKLAMLIFLEEI